MWIVLAFLSAFLLGCYEVSKKQALDGNAVLPVLFMNTLISSLLFVPFILLSYTTDCLNGTLFYVPHVSLEDHGRVFIKSLIVLSSWITGYFSLKHLPITLSGTIKAMQPIVTLLGAMLLFGERLNVWQWTGVSLALLSFFLLSGSGKKEGIRFTHNRWIFYAGLSMLLGSLTHIAAPTPANC
jgi:transporter family protein